MEKIIRRLKNEIILLRKEYNELSKTSERAQDFYRDHEGKSCERLIQRNCELKSMLTTEKGNNRWNLEYLCLLFYSDLIDVDRYKKLVPEEDIYSFRMLEYHLTEDESAQEIYILKYEDKVEAIDRLEYEKEREERIKEREYREKEIECREKEEEENDNNKKKDNWPWTYR